MSFYPNSWMDTTKLFVKRVIAKSGDTIEIKNGVVYLNNTPFEYSSEIKDTNNHEYVLKEEKIPLSNGEFFKTFNSF